MMALLLALVVGASGLWAQEAEPAEAAAHATVSVGHDAAEIVRRFPRDQFAIWTAPAHLGEHRRAWRYVIPFAVAGTLIGFDRRLSSNLPGGHGGASATIANIGLDGTGAAAGAYYLVGVLRHDDHDREAGLLAAESLVDSIVPHTVLSLAFGRRRPYQGAGEEIGEGDFFARHSASASFPSGHSMYTWAMASTLADESPRRLTKLLWYTVATTVTVSRVTGREHFASDVVVGGAIGYLIAKHVYRAHHHVDAESK